MCLNVCLLINVMFVNPDYFAGDIEDSRSKGWYNMFSGGLGPTNSRRTSSSDKKEEHNLQDVPLETEAISTTGAGIYWGASYGGAFWGRLSNACRQVCIFPFSFLLTLVKDFLVDQHLSLLNVLEQWQFLLAMFRWSLISCPPSFRSIKLIRGWNITFLCMCEDVPSLF